MFCLRGISATCIVLLVALLFTSPVLAQGYTISVNPTLLNFGEVKLGMERVLELNVSVANLTNNPVDLIVNLTPGLGFYVDRAIWTVPANTSNYSIVLKVIFRPIDRETYKVPLTVAIVNTVGFPGNIPSVTNITKAVVVLNGKGD